MPTNTVASELAESLGVNRKSGEAVQDYLKRLGTKANDMGDKDWDALSRKAQDWVNDALKAIDNKKSIAVPEGLAEPDEGEGEEAAGEAAGDEAGEKPATNRAARGRNRAPAKTEESTVATKTKTPAAGKASGKPAAAKEKEPAAAKEKANPPGRPKRFTDDSKITVIKKENPYRDGSLGAKVFACYKTGETVAKFVVAAKKVLAKAETTREPEAFLSFDLRKGNIKAA